ncbi:MAG: Ni/Fe-hydrogenase, b-type cytochrome subunit [Desulfuromonadia bacterium]
MSDLQIKYVWEIPVRVTHWVTMISIVCLSITGFLIGNPRTLASETTQFVMGWIRFIHFTFAYLFAVGLAVRLWWSIMGNQYAGWRQFFPWTTKQGRERIIDTLAYYSFLRKRVPHVVGHNPVASTIYTILMGFYLMMIATGFALYTEHRPGGFSWALFGWLTDFFPNQYLRLAHHLGMWFIIGFVFNHIYTVWLMDIKERGGIVSSMFSGYKTIEKETK